MNHKKVARALKTLSEEMGIDPVDILNVLEDSALFTFDDADKVNEILEDE